MFASDFFVKKYMDKFNLDLNRFCEKCHIMIEEYKRTFLDDDNDNIKYLYVINHFTNIPIVAMIKDFIPRINYLDILKDCK